MGPVLGELLPLAVGVAISPIPVVAAILMILSKHGGGAGGGFAVGWVVGIGGVTAVVTALSGRLGDSADRHPSVAAAWIKIVLGVLLVLLAVAQWRGRADTTPPGWMRALDQLTAIKAAGLGMLLSAANPKNLLLCLSAGVAVGAADLDVSGEVVAVVVFTALAAASVLVVVLGYAFAADRLRGTLDAARIWLQDNNHTVMAVVLLLMGAVVVGKGLAGL
ncbi:GAP family protein [Nocardia wallacei]|uniref:Membrane protein n=1 Tax=Nocardia wallacei TaxID=480035 RepID=A0A7G1KL79_9NOCA|nr:GAP family protein [Nocardia wallacei]BCK55898.1 membrane protein [Nocardia wallacei]